ncbi:hypothetical protein PIROE2DRAFT_15636, partial [Piromyces sp. E2]
LLGLTKACEDFNYAVGAQCYVDSDGYYKVTINLAYSNCYDDNINNIISNEKIKSIEFPYDFCFDWFLCAHTDFNECRFPDKISTLTNLEKLNLESYINMLKDDFALIPKTVKELSISSVSFTKYNFKELSKLTHIKKLSILRHVFTGEGVFPIIPKSVKELTLDKITLTQDNINEIIKLPNLKKLTFNGTNFDKVIVADDLTYFKNLKSLVLNNINYFKFDDKSLPENIFKVSKNIKELRISDTHLNKNNINEIYSLKKLEILYIEDCHLSEDVVAASKDSLIDFTKFKNLKEFKIDNCK